MRAVVLSLLFVSASIAQDTGTLPDSQPLLGQGDFSAEMVEGIGRWLTRETSRIVEERDGRWRQAAEGQEWEIFAENRRAELRKILGVSIESAPRHFEEVRSAEGSLPAEDGRAWQWQRVRWPVREDVHGEGLLLRPKGEAKAVIIAVPDADQLPEQLVWAQRFVEAGCMVLIPTLVDRDDRWSGSEILQRYTNQPHREWIYRQAFEMGRTLIGYEVEKILAALDALLASESEFRIPKEAIGIAGNGEGGLVALQAAALDRRIGAVLVSGYVPPDEQVFREPIYRNVFGVLREFGDSQLAALIAPRPLIVERSRPPVVTGPPAARDGRKGAAPGAIRLATAPASGANEPVHPGSSEAIEKLLKAVGITPPDRATAQPASPIPISKELADARQRRTVRELQNHTQRLVADAERARDAAVWAKVKPGAEWETTQRELRRRLWEEVIGRIPPEQILPPKPRSRIIREDPAWVAHEVMLDVLPDVRAWGWLVVPRDLKPGERRPVVVCQHGLEGLPEDVVNNDPQSRAFGYYKGFAAKLAERGFIVFAPHNPYRGGDKFRMLQRQANPIGLSLFSFIIAQHDAATRWLASLPFVDPERIAFYGLSYGGKTAMRVPAILDRYCLSICSGDFNEWVRKNVSTEAPYSYMFTGEWEMPEWNLAYVANYAEMAMLIAPRPFMVERGHHDGVAVDEWVGYEYAKVRRGFTKLGIANRTEIEWFDGPHTIHGAGTFEFLHKHLRWPAPQ